MAFNTKAPAYEDWKKYSDLRTKYMKEWAALNTSWANPDRLAKLKTWIDYVTKEKNKYATEVRNWKPESSSSIIEDPLKKDDKVSNTNIENKDLIKNEETPKINIPKKSFLDESITWIKPKEDSNEKTTEKAVKEYWQKLEYTDPKQEWWDASTQSITWYWPTDYTWTSIIDYLNWLWKPSTYSDRSILAKELWIQNYTWTAEQNTKILELLRTKSWKPTNGPNWLPLSYDDPTAPPAPPAPEVAEWTDLDIFKWEEPENSAYEWLNIVLRNLLDPSDAPENSETNDTYRWLIVRYQNEISAQRNVLNAANAITQARYDEYETEFNWLYKAQLQAIIDWEAEAKKYYADIEANYTEYFEGIEKSLSNKSSREKSTLAADMLSKWLSEAHVANSIWKVDASYLDKFNTNQGDYIKAQETTAANYRSLAEKIRAETVSLDWRKKTLADALNTQADLITKSIKDFDAAAITKLFKPGTWLLEENFKWTSDIETTRLKKLSVMENYVNADVTLRRQILRDYQWQLKENWVDVTKITEAMLIEASKEPELALALTKLTSWLWATTDADAAQKLIDKYVAEQLKKEWTTEEWDNIPDYVKTEWLTWSTNSQFNTMLNVDDSKFIELSNKVLESKVLTDLITFEEWILVKNWLDAINNFTLDSSDDLNIKNHSTLSNYYRMAETLVEKYPWLPILDLYKAALKRKNLVYTPA